MTAFVKRMVVRKTILEIGKMVRRLFKKFTSDDRRINGL